ncbi:PTBP3 protein, partial [Chloroceryle aenea]|nr:PTBP3 protein [Chloroceryle aenea]
GPDKLLFSGVTNRPLTMNNTSIPSTVNENHKRFQGEMLPFFPSRVLHLRQIPRDVTEDEVLSLGIPFGKVTNLLLLKRKSQAFLEMASEEAAINMVTYYNLSIPYLRSQPVYVQFSNHKELRIYNLPHQAGANVVNAVQPGSLATASALPQEVRPIPGQGCVLRIILENVCYTPTLETLYQVFSKFGCVLKIITFTRSNKLQALLQYADFVSAYHAKVALDGRSLYPDCCTLNVDFSRLTDLKVKYNNAKSRDFTCHDLPFGEGQSPLEPLVYGPFGTPGAVFPPHAGTTTRFASPVGLPEGAATRSAASRQRPSPSATHLQRSRVILVSNLNAQAVTIDALFTLFGVYGNVQRVKIMFKIRENALVQMASTAQAHLAVSYLNGQTIYGRILHASLSKYQKVLLPGDEHQDQSLTKDYSKSHLHRFKKSSSKKLKNICPPTDTLHVSNILPSVTADNLKKLFTDLGSTVQTFRYLARDHRTALIQLGSVEEALEALIGLHNYNIGENHHLKISFTKLKI